MKSKVRSSKVGTGKKHWTQTPEGKRKMALRSAQAKLNSAGHGGDVVIPKAGAIIKTLDTLIDEVKDAANVLQIRTQILKEHLS